jgi:MYND finger
VFMVEWWWLGDKGGDGLHMCSNVLCGRREMRKNGFRRCSQCAVTMYCSHACQEVHWIMEHRATCIQVPNVWQRLFWNRDGGCRTSGKQGFFWIREAVVEFSGAVDVHFKWLLCFKMNSRSKGRTNYGFIIHIILRSFNGIHNIHWGDCRLDVTCGCGALLLIDCKKSFCFSRPSCFEVSSFTYRGPNMFHFFFLSNCVTASVHLNFDIKRGLDSSRNNKQEYKLLENFKINCILHRYVFLLDMKH